jgi:electron transfer flavoprotein beta subunit
VKRVPDTAADKNLDPGDFTLDRENVETIINPVDEYGIEEALKLKEQHGGEVTVLTMGPAGAEKDAVRKALAMGADKGVMITDDVLHGSDAMATAYTLSLALALQDFDLVIMGSEATDSRNSLVPQAVAQYLALPGLTFVKKIERGTARSAWSARWRAATTSSRRRCRPSCRWSRASTNRATRR